MKKRKLSNLLGFTLLMASFFASCQVGVNNPSTPDSTKTGVITGKVIYENDNVTDYSDIQVTLFSTDGLMATNYCVSRGIATNARSVESITTTDKAGNYIFENVPEGVYTIYASSNSSKQKAVATNVTVRAAKTATADDLRLIATGSIRGKITIDEETTDVLGLDVFIAGTSYIAKVASDGTYEISDIPAETDYMLCVQKGEKTIIIEKSIEVKANDVLDAQTKDISSSEWESTAFEWLGSSESAPKNPKKHGAYFNTLDGCSYIWTGEKWDSLTKNTTGFYSELNEIISDTISIERNKYAENYQIGIPLPYEFYLPEVGDKFSFNWTFTSDIEIKNLRIAFADCSTYVNSWKDLSPDTIIESIPAGEEVSIEKTITLTEKAIGNVTLIVRYDVVDTDAVATLTTSSSTIVMLRGDNSTNNPDAQNKFTCTPTEEGIKFGGSLLSNIQNQTAKCTISIRDVGNGVTMNREYSLANSNAYESWEMVYPLVEKDKEYTFEVSTTCGATTISSEKVIVTAIGGLGEYKIENTDTYKVTLSDDKKTLTRTPQVFTNNPNVPVIDYATKYDIYSNSDTAASVWDGVWMPSQYCWDSSTNQVRDLTKFDETWFTYDSLKANLKGRRLGVVTRTYAKIAGYTYNGTTEFMFNDYKESFFDWDDEEQYKYFVLYKDPKSGEYYKDVPGTSLYYIEEELDENGNVIFAEKDAEGAIEVYGQLISYGDKIYEPAYVPATEIEDHIFSGFWDIDCESQKITSTSFPYSSNNILAKKEFVPVYLTPVYKPYKFNIHFVDENGDVVLPSIKTTQQTIRIESRPPERTNYICNYWKDSLSEYATTIYPWTDLKLTEYDTYLYAKYELERVKLNFLNEDGSIFETKEIYDYDFSVNKENNKIVMYTYTPYQKPVSSEDNKVFDYWECETEESFAAGESISSIGKISDVINFYPVFTELSDDDTTGDEVTEVVIFEVKSSYQDEAHCKEIGNKTALSEFAGKTVVLTIEYLDGDRTGWNIGEVFFATDNTDLYGTKTDVTIPLEGVAATDNICTIECPVDEVIAAMGDAEYISINLYNQTELVKISVK